MDFTELGSKTTSWWRPLVRADMWARTGVVTGILSEEEEVPNIDWIIQISIGLLNWTSSESFVELMYEEKVQT